MLLLSLALFSVFSAALQGDTNSFPDPVDWLNYDEYYGVLTWPELDGADGYDILIYSTTGTLLYSYSTTELNYQIGIFSQDVDCDLHGTNGGERGDRKRKRIEAVTP